MNPQTHDGTQSDTSGGIAASISSGLTTETNNSSAERTTSNAVTENHDVMSAEANINIVTSRRGRTRRHCDTTNKAERPVGSVVVDRSSLWSAADLPNHNVFAAGILHAFSPPSASNPELQDVCHMQTEDDEESDDDQKFYKQDIKR
ncbi:hypothetical protein PC128_g19581 [Phytophthora cactorum]|nr:hypothetical protein PC128_g19581 [Phytophthora cactorum]